MVSHGWKSGFSPGSVDPGGEGPSGALSAAVCGGGAGEVTKAEAETHDWHCRETGAGSGDCPGARQWPGRTALEVRWRQKERGQLFVVVL